MPSDRVRSGRRFFVRTVVGLSILAFIGSICFLPFAGRFLIREDPLEHADAILVLAGARVERWMEAVALFREGWAPRIVLSRGQVDDAESLLEAEGLHFPDEGEIARDLMVKMRIPANAIVLLPAYVDNTAQEAIAIDKMASTSSWRRLIVVTSKYHTRRSGFAFRREFRYTRMAIVVRASRYDTARPDRWWTVRKDVRLVTSELQKLLAYTLGLGG